MIFWHILIWTVPLWYRFCDEVPGGTRVLGHIRGPQSHHITGVGVVAPHKKPPPAYLDEPGVAHGLESHGETC
jgi:hypothetical protein